MKFAGSTHKNDRASMKKPGFCDKGGVLVEVSLVLAAAMVLTALVVDFGRLIFTYDRMISAVRAGARVASVTQPDKDKNEKSLKADDSRIVNVVKGMLAGTTNSVNSSPLIVPLSIVNRDGQICSSAVTVSARVFFKGLFSKLLGWPPFTLHYRLTMRYNGQQHCF